MSALIFVALAVAWAAYLVPKALRYHEDGVSSRSVDRFSHRMRVLARREPVDARRARLVVQPGRTTARSEVSVKPTSAAAETPAPAGTDLETPHQTPQPTPQPTPRRTPAPVARREAARAAARRRRRVLGALLAVLVVVTGLALAGLAPGWVVALPVVLLVAWLVACRLMVRQERGLAGRRAQPHRPPVPEATTTASLDDPEPVEAAVELDPDATGSMPAVVLEDAVPASLSELAEDVVRRAAAPAARRPLAPGEWDPQPMTLPTYVAKPAANRRTVQTIDLEATGVWTSGRTEADASLARQAGEAERAARTRREGEGGRAVGS